MAVSYLEFLFSGTVSGINICWTKHKTSPQYFYLSVIWESNESITDLTYSLQWENRKENEREVVAKEWLILFLCSLLS